MYLLISIFSFSISLYGAQAERFHGRYNNLLVARQGDLGRPSIPREAMVLSKRTDNNCMICNPGSRVPHLCPSCKATLDQETKGLMPDPSTLFPPQSGLKPHGNSDIAAAHPVIHQGIAQSAQRSALVTACQGTNGFGGPCGFPPKAGESFCRYHHDGDLSSTLNGSQGSSSLPSASGRSPLRYLRNGKAKPLDPDQIPKCGRCGKFRVKRFDEWCGNCLEHPGLVPCPNCPEPKLLVNAKKQKICGACTRAKALVQ